MATLPAGSGSERRCRESGCGSRLSEAAARASVDVLVPQGAGQVLGAGSGPHGRRRLGADPLGDVQNALRLRRRGQPITRE